ncbi:MAG: hypothetical protein E6G97_20590 [Alphaproteobacteria bacterium]|nr:MAG: hypothetical protein E6G97_20590 [Alphaproteobacteria bacterium]
MTAIKTIGAALSLLAFVLLPVGSGAVAAPATAGGTTYGDKPVFQSSNNIQYSLSDDKKAFTITFNPAFEAAVGANTSDTALVGTNVLSVVIPVTGKDVNTTFVLTASITAEDGAGGLLMVNVNDQQTITRFKKTSEKEVLVQLKYRAKNTGDIRLTVFLLAERDAAHPKAAALIHALAIDSDLAVASKRKKKDTK